MTSAKLQLDVSTARRVAIYDMTRAIFRLFPGRNAALSAGPNLRWYDKLRYKYHGRLEWTAIDCGVRLMSPAAAGFSTMDVLVQGPELPDFESLAHNTDHS